MSVSKTLTNAANQRFKVIAVDVPERPDLVYVYCRHKKNDKHKSFLMERTSFAAATTVEDLRNEISAKLTKERGLQVYAAILSCDEVSKIQLGFPKFDILTFGQELEGYRMVIITFNENGRTRMSDANGNRLAVNKGFTLYDFGYDIDRLITEEANNPAITFIKDETSGSLVFDFPGDKCRCIKLSVALTQEQEDEAFELKEDDYEFFHKMQVVSKYRKPSNHRLPIIS